MSRTPTGRDRISTVDALSTGATLASMIRNGAIMDAEDYFTHSRPEVRALVPTGARIVVDVGCGAGAMGAALKSERPGIEVRGIEPNAEAAACARAVLDDVAVASGEQPMPASWPAPDCVVLADVLEHMVDPWASLRYWRTRLGPGGSVVVSLPNVGHWSVGEALSRGRWDYTEDGLLDRTHLRFFTRATAVELLEGAGFEVVGMFRAILLPHTFKGNRLWRPRVRRGLELERAGLPVPGHVLRALDACSRQVVLGARAVESVRGRGGGAR